MRTHLKRIRNKCTSSANETQQEMPSPHSPQEISTTEERLNDFSFKQAVQERLSPRWEENDDGTSHIGDLYICHPNDPAHTRCNHETLQSRTERLSKPCAVKFRLQVHHHYLPWNGPELAYSHYLTGAATSRYQKDFTAIHRKPLIERRKNWPASSINKQELPKLRTRQTESPNRLNHYHDAAEKLRSIH